ncbi:MAG: hypothetical protein BSOLF_1412 [Candidatus Carbobacillus altaicus]|uniref:Uncharacterized protein n=1 Tax=Candidatus Carbonibacillus altaicus TaxID=2163959 RepID=A0A2R6Y4D7_9BACL|nr:MAG: hypothetical protein BSOLF_1412 [Candidatus Carbobacillus altaicus]
MIEVDSKNETGPFIHSLGKILPSHVAYYQLDVFERLK